MRGRGLRPPRAPFGTPPLPLKHTFSTWRYTVDIRKVYTAAMHTRLVLCTAPRRRAQHRRPHRRAVVHSEARD